jgi:hypothetical protein
LAPDCRLKGIRDLKPPQSWYRRAGVREAIEQRVCRRRALVLEYQAMVSEASVTRLKAQGRPS